MTSEKTERSRSILLCKYWLQLFILHSSTECVEMYLQFLHLIREYKQWRPDQTNDMWWYINYLLYESTIDISINGRGGISLSSLTFSRTWETGQNRIAPLLGSCVKPAIESPAWLSPSEAFGVVNAPDVYWWNQEYKRNWFREKHQHFWRSYRNRWMKYLIIINNFNTKITFTFQNPILWKQRRSTSTSTPLDINYY